MTMPTIFRSFVTAMAAGLVLVLGAAAASASGFPPVFGGGDTLPGQPGRPGSSDGSTVPTPPPAGKRWVSGSISCPQEIRANCAWNEGSGSIQYPNPYGYEIHGRCPARTVSGDRDWLATGASWIHLVNGDGTFGGSYSYACAYPPQPQDTQVRCPISLRASISMIEPVEKRLLTNTATSKWSSDRASVAKCGEDLTAKAFAPIKDLGAYRFDLTGRVKPCTARSYPGTNRPARIIRCGATQTTTRVLTGALWCDGRVRWATGARAWEQGRATGWTWQGCVGERTGVFQCRTGDDAGSYAGYRATDRPVESFGDGVARRLAFPAFNPGGDVVRIRNLVSSIGVARGSSPWRSGVSMTSSTQPFSFPDGARAAGDRREWPVAFYAASMPDAPFRMAVRRTLDADVRVQTVTVQAVNFDTMEIITRTTTRTVTAGDVTCSTPYAEVALLHARNSTS